MTNPQMTPNAQENGKICADQPLNAQNNESKTIS